MEINRETQYLIDTITAMTERTLHRLWVLIILLVVLLFGSNAAWVWYEAQYQEVTVTQDVQQDADFGSNHFIGGDYYGKSES